MKPAPTTRSSVPFLRVLSAVVVALLITVGVITAQEPAPVRAPPPAARAEGSVAAPVAAGIGLGLAGFLAGGLVGAAMASDCSGDEFCGLGGFFLGAAAGGTAGMSLGVHLGNGRRGSFGLDVLTGAIIWGAGIGVALLARDETVTGAVFVAIPIAQLIGTVAVERSQGRSREHLRAAALSIAPVRGGGLAMALSLPLPR